MIDQLAHAGNASVNTPRIRFLLVAAGSALALGSIALTWAQSGAAAIPGYRVPSAIRLLSDAGLTDRWSLVPWAAVPIGAACAWLILWIRGAAVRLHAALGTAIAVAGVFFMARTGAGPGPIIALVGGFIIALGGIAAGSAKGRAT